MGFWNSTVDTLSLIVSGIGCTFAVLGAVGLMEGYANDNAAAKNQGIKQAVAGAGIIIIGLTLVPQLAGIF